MILPLSIPHLGNLLSSHLVFGGLENMGYEVYRLASLLMR